jgi:hypothetical protein
MQPLADGARHIGQKRRFFRAMLRALGHVGGEIVHLPFLGDRQVQRIDLAADDHRAVFAHAAVGTARIDILNDQDVGSGDRVQGGREPVRGLDPTEIVSRMER